MSGTYLSEIAEASDRDDFYNRDYARAILMALQGKHVYQGTVPHHVKMRRRAANKVARASRRLNRGAR